MQPHGADRDRAAHIIVTGIGDKLIVEGERSPISEADQIIGLNDFLGPVAEGAVADVDAEASCCKESPIIARKPVDDASQAYSVVGAAPGRSLQHAAERCALVDVGPGHDFGLTALPAQPREEAEIIGDGLLEIADEAKFRSGLARPRDVRRIGIERGIAEVRIGQRRGETATIALAVPARQPEFSLRPKQ
jgi:hypothetical protein